MAPQAPPKHHDETTLVVLEQVLKDVCQVLKAHDPDRNWEKDAEVQQALAEKLMDLAAEKPMDLADAGARPKRALQPYATELRSGCAALSPRRLGDQEANRCCAGTST